MDIRVLEDFIEGVDWITAKSYAKTWPHEYIVRGKDGATEQLFVELAIHIREHGYAGYFFAMKITYFDYNGMVYWTQGAPIPDTIIINRVKKELSFEYKRSHGLLPKAKGKAKPKPSAPTDDAIAAPVKSKAFEDQLSLW